MAKLRATKSKLRPPTRTKLKVTARSPNPFDGFYMSTEWRSLVGALKRKRFGHPDNARCEDYLCQQPGRRGIRVFADHIHELRDGGAALAEHNIMFRCGACHTRVSHERRALRYSQGPTEVNHGRG